MKTDKYPFIIIGAENCKRCEILIDHLKDAEVIKIPNKPLGFGDSFALLTDLLSIPSCKACKVRRSFLNKWFPYPWNANKEVRKARNAVLKLGHESLPVLLDKSYNSTHDIEKYFKGFIEKYMKE